MQQTTETWQSTKKENWSWW